ncbi:MAG TPA: succinate dehydrogenase, hydrophobic membrane anchor protein [Methylothermaceae bacterium]|nr:succinate dehydrogenase, hydrophobic membrane anchor protein [Methylothermaceae bacterium]
MAFRTPIGKAVGWGSAHTGTGHWWLQRVTALALIPLTLWLVWFLVCLLRADYPAVHARLANPWQSDLLLAYLLTAGYHAALGLQVIIEDYIHHPAVRVGVLLTVRLGLAFLMLVATLAVVKIVAGGGNP